MLSLAEALERLESPYAHEAYSALCGDPVLVVDADSRGGEANAAVVTAARAALAQLPCPSVALCAGAPSPLAAAVLDHFDLVVADEAELAPILGAIRRTPLAAMALVQLLRHGAQLDVHEALVAESLAYSTLQGGPEFTAWLARRPAKPQRGVRHGPAVLVSRDGNRLRLTLNRPEKRNAFSAEMRDALVEGLRIAVGDASIGEVAIDASGPCFSSGGDLDEFGTLPDPATAHLIRCTRNPGRLLAACADRVRFAVHGDCVGAGVELPAFGRRVVAAEDSSFQLPEVGMGLVPGAGGTVSIPRRIGRRRTAYLAFSGRRLDAGTALRWGLVDAIER